MLYLRLSSQNDLQMFEADNITIKKILTSKHPIMIKINQLKSILIKTTLILTILIAMISCDKDKVLSSSEYPSEITSYASTHFPNHSILQIVKDGDGMSNSFDVLLSDNISLEFNRKKELTEIDGKVKLPNSVIPDKIHQYVLTNYPDNYITKWKLDDGKQQIKLNNGIEIEFDKNNEFLRLD